MKGSGKPKLMDRMLVAAMTLGMSIPAMLKKQSKELGLPNDTVHDRQNAGSGYPQRSKHRVAMDKRAALKRRNVVVERARHRG